MSKISELSDGGALQSTDYLIAVRSGGNVKVQPAGMTFSSATFTTVDINGGTIDGVTIGGSSAGAITGTTGQFNTSLNVDGTVTADGFEFDYGDTLSLTSGSTGTDILSTGFVSGQGDYLYISPAGNSSTNNILFRTANASTYGDRLKIAASGDISFYEDTGTTPKLFWDASAEALGIGTSSPTHNLTVGDANAETTIGVAGNRSQFGFKSDLAVVQGGSGKGIQFNVDNNTFGSGEAMRIDTSGNLLVGTASTGGSTTGLKYEVGPNLLRVVRSGGEPIVANRQTSDGGIIALQKDGVAVGSIGTISSGGSQLRIGDTSTGLCFRDDQVAIIPSNSTSLIDNTTDLGNSAFRFDDIYASNGTIQTSDRNEKENIRELLEAEARVAQAAKGLLRAFQWKDSVAEKGDDARIHFGIIAQDLQAAFEAEGLDAGRYAMFIHSTWTDEETGEERSRMGVRYSELLAFIIAAL